MRFLLLTLLAFGCSTADPDPTSPSPWVYSHTLDLRAETTGCVSVAVLPASSGDIALRCDDEGQHVERCDDIANHTVAVYTVNGIENAWTHLRMKSCEAE